MLADMAMICVIMDLIIYSTMSMLMTVSIIIAVRMVVVMLEASQQTPRDYCIQNDCTMSGGWDSSGPGFDFNGIFHSDIGRRQGSLFYNVYVIK